MGDNNPSSYSKTVHICLSVCLSASRPLSLLALPLSLSLSYLWMHVKHVMYVMYDIYDI